MGDRILVFIPAYNCEPQIARVLKQLEAPWVRSIVTGAIVVDNRSTDGTAAAVEKAIAERGDGFVKLMRNEQNYGLGGSHKTAFGYARENGYDYLVVLHGDDQANIEDFRGVLESGGYREWDCVLGSRFMKGSKLEGYSALRIYGNHVFNIIYSICLGQRVSDLGAGINMYRVSALPQLEYEKHPDNLTFNCAMLAASVLTGARMMFTPITWREDDQVSNIKLVRQSLQTLRLALLALMNGRRFVGMELREKPISAYHLEQVGGGGS